VRAEQIRFAAPGRWAAQGIAVRQLMFHDLDKQLMAISAKGFPLEG
jgi:hypothetical protein